MSKFSIASILVVSTVIAGAAGIATASPMAAATTARKTVMTTRKTAPAPAMAAPAAPAMAKATATRHTVVKTAAAAPAGRMVTTKTSTGKTITYNCAKGGNLNKKACK